MKSLFLILCFIFSISSFAQSFLKSEIKTGPYTVPKGKIAIVKGMSGDVQLNGSYVGETKSVVPPNVNAYSLSGVNDSVCISVTASCTAMLFGLPVSSGTSWTYCTDHGGSVSISSCYNTTITVRSNSPLKEIKAKSGDVISGTRYLIELYER